MESNNLRDLQNLTNQILSESTQAEEHFMNSWPYTAPYLSEEANVEESIAEVKTEVVEESDLFDVLSNFLVSEGYSEQESLEMMAIMTEEQRGEILDFLESMASANRMKQIMGQSRTKPRVDFATGRKTPATGGGGTAAQHRSRGGQVQHMGRDLKGQSRTSKPNSSVSSPGYDTRRIGGYDLRRLPPN